MKPFAILFAVSLAVPAVAGSSFNIEKVMDRCQSSKTGNVDRSCVRREMKKMRLNPEEKKILNDVAGVNDAKEICREIRGDQIDSGFKPIDFDRCVVKRMRGEI